MTHADEQACLEKAQEYVHHIQEIMDLISDKPFLSPDGKLLARHLMKALKERLAADFRIGDTAREMAERSDAEQQYYRVVLEAKTRIRSAWNSDPIKSAWCDQLYACRIDFTHYLHHS